MSMGDPRGYVFPAVCVGVTGRLLKPPLSTFMGDPSRAGLPVVDVLSAWLEKAEREDILREEPGREGPGLGLTVSCGSVKNQLLVHKLPNIPRSTHHGSF